MPLAFPAVLVKRQRFIPVNAARGGGASTSGVEQFADSGDGLWNAELDVLIDGHDDILLWDAFVADMRGQFGTVNVPYDQRKRAPWPVDPQGRLLTPWVTRRRQLDGTIYEDPAVPPESEIIVTVGSSTVMGATSIQLVVGQGGAIRRGHKFSIEDEDGKHTTYQIMEVTSVVDDETYTCRIWPDIRATAAGADPVEMITPICEMRFVDNDQGQLSDDGLGFGLITVKFKEAM